MEQPETHKSAVAILLPQAVWGTLTTAQQEIVLRTIVQICCQMVVQQEAQVGHESNAE